MNLPCDLNEIIFSFLDRPSKFAFRWVNKEFKKIPSFKTCHIQAASAKLGYLKIIKWLHKIGCPWNPRICGNAARNGYLEILEWAHANGYPLSSNIMYNAAAGGNIDILKWLRKNNFSWMGSISLAAKNGHLEAIKWMREQGCPWGILDLSCAAQNKHFEVLQWMLENGHYSSRKYDEWVAYYS